MNWNHYETTDICFDKPLNDLPRVDARRVFDRSMSNKDTRIEMLRRLLEANEVDLEPTDSGIQRLNSWFLANVEADPDKPGRLRPEWYSVVTDVGLFLGDALLARCPKLRWEFFTSGKKNVSYQHHVIMGFTRVPNPRFNIDFERLVATYAHQIVASRGSIATYGTVTVRGVEIDVDAAAARLRTTEIETDAFLRWLKNAEVKA